MEMGEKTEAVHGEIHLPEAIVEQIQSFLSCKEAAQTSILCKTWYNAWASRPVVDLDQRNFQIRGGADPGPLTTDEFLESSKEIMRRYEESNLKIKSFRFCMENMETGCFSLVNELIVNAMKLDACDLNVELMPRTAKFDLPHEVLRSENLVRLSVSGCRIDFEATGGKVGFSKLKSLSLRGVRTILRNIGFFTFDMSSCPLIEELVLSECSSICPMECVTYNWEKLEVTRMWILGSLTEFGNQRVGSIDDAPIRPYNNLKRMYLEMIQIDGLLFNDMSRRFPCLKDLTLKKCNGFRELQISSPSLEFLSVEHTSMSSGKFDVPRLRKFTFSCTSVPFRLSFEAASRECESYISIEYKQTRIRSSWLHALRFNMMRLKDFLMNLSLPKISLSLCFEMLFDRGFDLIENVPSQRKPEVENLMLSMRAPTSVCSSLLEGVFRTCRPKFITQEWLPQSCSGREKNSDMVKLLCETLIDKESEGYCIPSRRMFDEYGLEKVDVEVLEDSLAEWRSLPWKAMVDALKSPEKKQKTRFKLRWE